MQADTHLSSTPRVLDASITDDARVRVAKGVRLATDVHLPQESRTAGYPVLLLRTPYGRRGEVDRVALVAEAATAAGFALVVQDVRGRFDSNGDPRPFLNEVSDGAQTIEWIAGQKWSNGSVIPIGDSYCGFTAWAAGLSSHESIAAIIARVTTTDIVDEWFYRDGVLRLQLNLPWLDFAFGERALPGVEEWKTWPIERVMAVLPEAVRSDWLRMKPDGEAWSALADQLRSFLNVKAPIVHWTGWYDVMARGQIRNFERRTRSGHLNDILIVDPTDHEFRTADGQPPGGDHMTDLMSRVHDAYSFALGSSRRPNSRITPMGTSTNVIRNSTWYLTGGSFALVGPEGGALSSQPDALPSVFAWFDDPADPAISQVDWLWGQLRDGLPDESRTHLRPDVATFTGAERESSATLLGHASVGLNVRLRDRDAHLVAELTDVHPDGKAVKIVDGAAVARAQSGWQSVRVDLGYVGYTLERGHRLRVSIASSSYPQYPVTPDTWGPTADSAQDILAQTGIASYVTIVEAPAFDGYLGGNQGRLA